MNEIIERSARGSGAIDDGGFVDVQGNPQWLTLRGRDRANPALLIIGGPGVAHSAFGAFFAPWERDFTLVQWDQPGAGATFATNGAAGTGELSIERIARDGLAVAALACRALRRRTLGLVCASGGTIVGLTMIARAPERFGAYVGTGQIVDWPRQDRASYEALLEDARARGDRDALVELERIGPPPYPDTATDAIKSKHAGALTAAEIAEFTELMRLTGAAFADPRVSFIAHGLDYGDPRSRSTAVYDALRTEIVTFDALALGRVFRVPLFVFQGDRDRFTVTSEVERWLAAVAAPRKMLARIEDSGHSAIFLREPMLELLNAHVRPVLAASG